MSLPCVVDHHRQVRGVQRAAGAGDQHGEAVGAHEREQLGAVLEPVVGRRVHVSRSAPPPCAAMPSPRPMKPRLLGGGGLDVDRRRRDAEVGGDVADHARDVRRHARRLRDDGGVDVDDLAASARRASAPRRAAACGCRSPENAGSVSGIVLADVAQPRGAEQRVADRVQQHVGVGVAVEALVVRDLDAADHQLAARRPARARRSPARSSCVASVQDAFGDREVLRPGHLEVLAAAGDQRAA